MKQKNPDMAQGNPIRLIILFSMPMLIGSIFQLMYNMADTVVVGEAALLGARPMMRLLGTPAGVIYRSVVYIQITGGLIYPSLSRY